MAIEALLDEMGEFGSQAALVTLVREINTSLQRFIAEMHKMAHHACSDLPPSLDEQQADRMALAGILERQFGPLVGKLMGQPNTQFLDDLGAFGPAPSRYPSHKVDPEPSSPST
jgi:hypothetical protein